MNRRPTPFWKQPRGLVVLGLGAGLLLGTAWLGFTRLGPGGSAIAEAPPPPSNRMDENALIAANAERPDAYAAAPPQANAIEASADGKLGDDEAPAAAPVERPESRFNPAEIAAEAEAAIDAAEAQADKLEAQVEAAVDEDGKD